MLRGNNNGISPAAFADRTSSVLQLAIHRWLHVTLLISRDMIASNASPTRDMTCIFVCEAGGATVRTISRAIYGMRPSSHIVSSCSAFACRGTIFTRLVQLKERLGVYPRDSKLPHQPESELNHLRSSTIRSSTLSTPPLTFAHPPASTRTIFPSTHTLRHRASSSSNSIRKP